jgi:5-methyltetrahydropteroyltriglutamate--homocysteine methyltransferase
MISCARTRATFGAALAKGCAQGASRFHRRPLAIKIDPLGNLLQSFVDLNNLALARFSAEIVNVGVHTCPGAGDD